jgi:hypothetical protein
MFSRSSMFFVLIAFTGVAKTSSCLDDSKLTFLLRSVMPVGLNRFAADTVLRSKHGEEGGNGKTSGSSAGRRIKVDAVLVGVLPILSKSGVRLCLKALRWPPPRRPVEGTIEGRLEGGMISSVLIRGVSIILDLLEANTSLKRTFAGVAFTTGVPK